MNPKTAYICGPLTELTPGELLLAKNFYEQIADVYRDVTGERAFVPHEHCDPLTHVGLSPTDVDAIERRQVCEHTTVVVVVASFSPSWGGGIEVEMANKAGVPVIIVVHEQKQRVSRLLRGNPAVRGIVFYRDEDQALELLRREFASLFAESIVSAM